MSSNVNIFCEIGPLWGESTDHRWIPLTKAIGAEFFFFFFFDVLVSDPGMHHGTCSGSLTRGGEENFPGITGACETHKFTFLVRGPWKESSPVTCLQFRWHSMRTRMIHQVTCHWIPTGHGVSCSFSIWNTPPRESWALLKVLLGI